jgi:phosphoribosylglycinamide formyltransferase-1
MHARTPLVLACMITGGRGRGEGVGSVSSADVLPQPSPRSPARIVVLVSGAGTLLQSLLDAAAEPDPAFSVAGVVADRPDAFGLQRAREAGVPTATVRPKDFPDRVTWDLAVTKAVDVFGPDLVVLAGFMRLLGAPFLDRFGGRTLNTHPALLPAFPGAQAVRAALVYGVKVTGCTVMLIDDGTDTGPVLAQQAVPVGPDDDEAALHERIKVAERALLVDVVTRMCRNGWQVDGRRASIDGRQVPVDRG